MANEYGVEERNTSGFSGLKGADIETMFSSAIAGSSDDDQKDTTVDVVTTETMGAPATIEEVASAKTETIVESPTVANDLVSPKSTSVIKTTKVSANDELIAKIIKTLDAYRGLSNNSKSVASQFICGDSEVDSQDEAVIVSKALNCDVSKGVAMKHLVTAYQERERVERLFYLLQISGNELSGLGKLVEMFEDTQEFTYNDTIKLAKEIESCIDKFDASIVEYVADTQKVLSAAM